MWWNYVSTNVANTILTNFASAVPINADDKKITKLVVIFA